MGPNTPPQKLWVAIHHYRIHQSQLHVTTTESMGPNRPLQNLCVPRHAISFNSQQEKCPENNSKTVFKGLFFDKLFTWSFLGLR